QPAGAARLAGRTGRGPRVASAGPAPAPPADPGCREALALTREPGPAAAAGVRGPALDRRRDTGAARRPCGQPADGAAAPVGELSARVRARLESEDVLSGAAAGSAGPGERGRVAEGPGGRRCEPRAPEATASGAHRG